MESLHESRSRIGTMNRSPLTRPNPDASGLPIGWGEGGGEGSLADYKSAIQQIANLRYVIAAHT